MAQQSLKVLIKIGWGLLIRREKKRDSRREVFIYIYYNIFILSHILAVVIISPFFLSFIKSPRPILIRTLRSYPHLIPTLHGVTEVV